MKRALTTLALTLCFSSLAFAQDDEATEKTRKALAAAARAGTLLKTELTVNSSVSVKAVLIPRIDAKRIFGSEIANNYAVISLTVGNKSPDAALIIHGVFIDYHDWPLSGAAPEDLRALRSVDPYEASSFPNQVASEEYRLVRGQLLDAQTDTLRNRFLRWLTLAGNLAGAFTFSLNEQGIVKGIAAATGVGIPGIATAWPDKTIEQLNRVSDFGFRANKVIPKKGSDIVVCFFPIDRFLTAGFRKLFLKQPALFFAPLEILADKSNEKAVQDAVGELLQGAGLTYTDLRSGLSCFMAVTHGKPTSAVYGPCLNYFTLEKDPNSKEGYLRFKVDAAGNLIDKKKFSTFLTLQFLGSVSLNRVTITVHGVMSVDVNTIAARIDEVEMAKLADCGDANGQCFWTNATANGGVRKGVIRGAYLPGGKVALAEDDELGISDVKVIDEGSSDNELHFSFKLSKPVPNQTQLHVTVVKEEEATTEGAKARRLDSNTWTYLVAYSPAATAISSVSMSGVTLTVKGRGFTAPGAAVSPMSVTLVSEDRTEVKVPAAAITFANAGEFSIALAGLNLSARCWYAQVEVNGLTSNRSEKFLPTAPAPTLDSATHNGKFIFLKGNDLVNLSRCSGPKISFRLTQAGVASMPLTVENWSNGEPVLVLPEAAKTGSWKVEVLVNGNPIAPAAVTVDLTAP